MAGKKQSAIKKYIIICVRIPQVVDFCNSASYTRGMNKSYVILGIKHSGKTTQSKFLAEHLGCPVIDIDEVMQKNTGLSPRKIYEDEGPCAFMNVEETVCEKVAKMYKDQLVVVSTGGGICDNAPALHHLRALGTFVFIEVPEEIACERILKKAEQLSDGTWKGLPAYINNLKPKNENAVREIFGQFYKERTEVYKSIADITVAMKDGSKDDNFKLLKQALGI